MTFKRSLAGGCLVVVFGLGLSLAACGANTAGHQGGPGMMGDTSGQGSVAPGEILVTLDDMGMMHTAFSITLSAGTAPAGTVTFVVQNHGSRTHEFVVLQTDAPAGHIPITSFEGESDRINEDSSGTNVGETGDMAAGLTKRITLQLVQGHYALVCNLPDHYRAGMHRDFVVT